MQDTLQKSQLKTPENSSSFLSDTPDNYLQMLSPESKELQPRYTTSHQNTLAKLATMRETLPERPLSNDKAVAQNIINIGGSVIAYRNREIILDGGLTKKFNLSDRSQQKLGFAEVLLGKKVGRAADKVMKGLTLQPVSGFDMQNAAYMRREAEVGRRVLGQKDMQLFCQDQNTWVWHIDNDEQATFLYHVRPDGVLKERIGGEISRVSDGELASFAHWTNKYHQEVINTVYRQQPESAEGRYQSWASPSTAKLSYN